MTTTRYDNGRDYVAAKQSSDHLISQVTKSLQETFATAKRSGNLEGLLFTGLTPAGMDLFQAYVDSTGDVQTAAIMASYVSPARFKDNRVDRWVETYHNLLDSWSAFHFRCQFDIERGRMLQHLIQAGEIAPFEWVERQLLIRCNYCNKVINSQLPLTETVALGGAAGITAPDNLKVWVTTTSLEEDLTELYPSTRRPGVLHVASLCLAAWFV